MKWIPPIIRCILTLALVYGAYTETGTWTALNLLGLWIVIEVQVIIAKLKSKNEKSVDDIIKDINKILKQEVP